MKFRHTLLAFALVLFTGGLAHADLNASLRSLNIGAEGNMGGFRTWVGAHFGASGPDIDLVLRSVDRPADAALCFWLSLHTGRSIDVVMHEYRDHRGQGWGALAKSLGIKPGSADFKALKRGDLGWHYDGAGGGHGKSKGRGQKKNKKSNHA